MPQSVEHHKGQRQAAASPRPVAAQVVGAHRRHAIERREHQGIGRESAETQRKAQLKVLAPVVTKHLDGGDEQGNGAAARFGLRRLKAQPGLRLFQGPLYAELGTISAIGPELTSTRCAKRVR